MAKGITRSISYSTLLCSTYGTQFALAFQVRCVSKKERLRLYCVVLESHGALRIEEDVQGRAAIDTLPGQE